MMARMTELRDAGERDPGPFARLIWRISAFFTARPALFGLLALASVVVCGSGVLRWLALVAAVAIGFSMWYWRDVLRFHTRKTDFLQRWEGPPGRTGLAAQLGLVPERSRQLPMARLEQDEHGGAENLIIDCPPGLVTDTVVDAVPAIREAMGAVEATAEVTRGKAQVIVHLIYYDVMDADVQAAWIAALEEGPTPDTTFEASDGTPLRPYWESFSDDKGDSSSDDGEEERDV